MTHPNMIVLYVEDSPRSAEFYSDILGKKPLESYPTFTMFELDSGLRLGLATKYTVEPAANDAKAGSAELVLLVADNEAVDATSADWKKRGVAMAQEPQQVCYGYTFTGLDPDGHRLRVLACA